MLGDSSLRRPPSTLKGTCHSPEKQCYWLNRSVPTQILVRPECKLQRAEMALVADISLCLAWCLLDTQVL